MTLEYWLGGILSVLLTIYLLYALDSSRAVLGDRHDGSTAGSRSSSSRS